MNSICWSKQNTKQRFKCKECCQLLTDINKSVPDKNKEIWFKKWIIGKDIFDKISLESGHSKSTLQRYFYRMLAKPPVLEFDSSDKVNLVIDGTYFPNDLCLIVYRNSHLKSTQLYRITNGEYYQEIAEDLESLLLLVVQIQSITSDEDKSAIKAIKKVCPNISFQRCLVHISRMSKIWLKSRPKHLSGFELKNIISKIHSIDSEYKKRFG